MNHPTSVQWVMRYLKDHPLSSLIVFVTAVFEPVMYMIPLFISADIVGILVDGGGWSQVWTQFRILIPISIIQVIVFFISSFLNEILAHRITTDMTQDLFDSLQYRSLTYHDSKDVGEIMARATNDTRSVNMALSPGIRLILALLSIWFVGLVLLYTVRWYLAVVGFIIFLIFLFLSYLYGKKVEPLSTKVLDELSDISSITTDSLGGVREIKAYAAEHLFKTKFAKKATLQAMSKEYEGKLGAWFYPDLLVRIFILGSVGLSLYLTFLGQMSIRDLVLITTVLTLVAGMSEEMSWVAFISVGGYAATKRLHSFVFDEDPHHTADGVLDFENLPASVEFDAVTFTYPGQSSPALNDVSFRIEDSETLAIVGSPGSGKSTLTKLIQRLYVPQQGKIMLGEYPIDEFRNVSLRQKIATVEQEVHLFNDTILENVRFGKPQASLEEVMVATKIAQAHDFIMGFSDGYETIIGEDGVRLSGGQAQRIAISRALLMNPEILIFDDGASALDARTEARIQEAIADVLKTRTTIITTHRLAIIAQADKILILENGIIKGFGNHESLIRTNTYYRKLFERHFELPPLLIREEMK